MAFVISRKAQVACCSWLREDGAGAVTPACDEKFEMPPPDSGNCPWNIVWVAGQWARAETMETGPSQGKKHALMRGCMTVLVFTVHAGMRQIGIAHERAWLNAESIFSRGPLLLALDLEAQHVSPCMHGGATVCI